MSLCFSSTWRLFSTSQRVQKKKNISLIKILDIYLIVDYTCSISGRDESQSINPVITWRSGAGGCATLHQRHIACRGDAPCNLIQLAPWLPLGLNGVSVHCWDCYNVSILSRGETVPTCGKGGNNPTGEEAGKKRGG